MEPGNKAPQDRGTPPGGFFSKLGKFLGLSPARDARGPQVHLAGFGKHPGWDDHVLDLGIETNALAAVQNAFYVRGIGQNIDNSDNSAWEKLEPGQRLPEFRHTFLWRKGVNLFAGRLWASRDSKMRARYPMVLCAQCAAVSMDWVVSVVPAYLEQAKQRCTETTSAADVRAIVASTQAALRQALPGGGAAAPPSAPPAGQGAAPAEGRDAGAFGASAPSGPSDPFDFLVARPELGPDHRGLLAILYEVERNMAAFRPVSPGTVSQLKSTSTHHVRVPTCGLSPFDASRLWIGFLTTLLSPSAPMLALHPIGEPWIDLIVGDPTPADLFCMMATLKKVPFTSDIPYKFPDDFLRRATRQIDQHRRPAPAGAPGAPGTSAMPGTPGAPNLSNSRIAI